MPIGFLHTAAVHTATFDALVVRATGASDTVAVVDESLLERARRHGPEHDGVTLGISRALDELEASGATVIVCTCSTIAGEAERLGRQRDVPVIRIDRPMAEAAVSTGPSTMFSRPEPASARAKPTGISARHI